MMRKRLHVGAALATMALGASLLASLPANASSIEHKDPTIHSADLARATKSNARPTSSPQLTYRGGKISPGGKVFIVFWGSQWGPQSGVYDPATATATGPYVTYGNDPSGVAPYEQKFIAGLFGAGDTWSTSTTQYCQSNSSITVPTGSATCPTGATLVGHPGSNPLGGVWNDAVLAPAQPTQSQLAAEAVSAATHFVGFDATRDQVVVSTSHGNSSSGFGTQYCAWHSSTSFSGGSLAYTNMPYMPDAGGSCGANFVNPAPAGALDGVSIVGGHEYGETITDMYPNGGWLDSNGRENGDKCAWISSPTSGASKNIILSTGTFAVQSLWSNNMNTGSGGCAIYYVDAVNQHG